MPLPVEQLADPIRDALECPGCLVLHAPTGSGKSTKVPQILADSGIPDAGRKIVILQPRRIAARMLARRVASERGGKPGGEVGYQVRFERVVGRQTRILFVTEGLLLRMFQSDPMLKDVGALIFDEFHERHLHSDLGIGLAMALRKSQRPDLRICAMSATLETRRLVEFLSPCKLVVAESRQHPVEIFYSPPSRNARAPERVWDAAANAFETVAANGPDGHILVFMPGVYEINRTIEAIRRTRHSAAYRILPLHGKLPPAEQDEAVAGGGPRKVIVATNVAETSLTIDGVTAVIDSGLVRMPGFDPRRGINTLLVEPVDQASAAQRAGRAGRTAPGQCIRLWNRQSHERRPPAGTPEALRIDLSEACLALREMGWGNPGEFPWLDPPPPESLERARRLLHDLGAVDAQGELTDCGKRMAGYPVHPRLARMLVEGEREGCPGLAAECVALCQGRAVILPLRDKTMAARRAEMSDSDSDVLLALRLWRQARNQVYPDDWCRQWGVHMQAAREADAVADSLMAMLGAKPVNPSTPGVPPAEAERLKICLLAGFPDHVAASDHPGNRIYNVAHGRRGELAPGSLASGATIILAMELDEVQKGTRPATILGMASALSKNLLARVFPDAFSESTETLWDERRREAVARRRTRFHDLVLEDAPGGEPDEELAAELLATRILSGQLTLNGWNGEVDAWIRRVNFTAAAMPELEIQPIDDSAREIILRQFCRGATSYRAVKNAPAMPAVREWLSREANAAVESAAPASIHLPGRKRPLKIRYEPENRMATVSARLQDFYDVPHERLTICHGRHRLTVELLAPNGRPAQTTNNLDRFWETSYANVKKELRGRYPKHEWR